MSYYYTSQQMLRYVEHLVDPYHIKKRGSAERCHENWNCDICKPMWMEDRCRRQHMEWQDREARFGHAYARAMGKG